MQTLYIIHGWTYTVEPWAKTIALLKKNGINVKMLNVPGLTSPSQKVWTIADYVAWANKNIPDGATALGHSNGGRILLNLLAENPGKLKHVILLDAAGVYEPSKKRDLMRKLSKAFAPLKKIKPLRKVIHKVVGASDYDHAPANMKQTLSNMLDSDKDLDISKVTTPTTIIWGEDDAVTPLRQGKVMHEKIAGSRFVAHKNWKHAPYLDDPAGLAKVITMAMKGL